jgi:hypothetical protein
MRVLLISIDRLGVINVHQDIAIIIDHSPFDWSSIAIISHPARIVPMSDNPFSLTFRQSCIPTPIEVSGSTLVVVVVDEDAGVVRVVINRCSSSCRKLPAQVLRMCAIWF